MAEGAPNENIFGPIPDELETPNTPPLGGLECHTTNFTFTFRLNQEPLVNAKHLKASASEWAPTSQASPSKKRIRLSDHAIRSPSPKRFCLLEDGETPSRPTSPRPQIRCPTSPPHSSRYNSLCPTNVDDDDSGSSSDISIDEPMAAANSHLIDGKEPAIVRKDHLGPLKNSKLTSFWSVETLGERESRIQQEFAAFRDEADAIMMDEAHLQRLKLLRKRAGDRERQQKHREMVREKKIMEGWVPGKKRVSMSSKFEVCENMQTHLSELSAFSCRKPMCFSPVMTPLWNQIY